MKITPSLLSIPPYLSTTWKNISSLHIREEKSGFTLVVTLQNRVQIEVPSLNKQTVDSIFEAHARYAARDEEIKEQLQSKNPMDGPFSFSLPMKSDGGLETLASGMAHNPEQADLPPLPADVLDKITMIARAFGLDNPTTLPPAEPHCNCIYCQVARALHGEASPLGKEITSEPDEVSAEDLRFRNWEIKQTSEKLYLVTNPLDANEHYSVFLGDPLGCTCGQRNCEHIRAVLNS